MSPEPNASGWPEWQAGARSLLDPVLEAAARLAGALDEDIGGGIHADAPGSAAATGDPSTRAEVRGTDLVEACAALDAWIEATPAPAGRDAAEGELRAAVGVFRNAAFASRSLDPAAPDQWAARVAVCRDMLGRGVDHVARYARLGDLPA